MTEPNHSTGADRAAEDARVIWPPLPAQAGGTAGNEPSRDPAVGALLRRLDDLPDLPVSRHGEVYALLHDELLAALNESIAAPPATGPAAAGPTTSPGDAKK
jgi:hypothetical protein